MNFISLLYWPIYYYRNSTIYIPDVWIYKTGIGSIQGTKRIRRTNNTRIKQTKLTHRPNSVDAIINDVL